MAESLRFRTFDEFWPHYVREHSKKGTRRLHLVGTSAALAVGAAAAVLKKPKLVKWALVVGYGPAWIGHFFIEKNKPATFRYPIWSLRGDLKMWSMALRGRLDDEVERILRETEPVVDDGGKGWVHMNDQNGQGAGSDRDTLN